MRVSRKPTETDAWQVLELKQLSVADYPAPLLDAINKGNFIGGNNWQVKTQSGWANCSDSDYLTVDAVGVIYPIPADVFDATYEILDPPPPAP